MKDGEDGGCRAGKLEAVTLDNSQPAPAPGATPLSTRLTGAVLSLLVGAIYGTVGTVAHQNVVSIGGTDLPVGLVLAVLGSLALLLGFRLLFDDRLAVLCAAIGLVGMIALFSLASPGGSILIPQGLIGLFWSVAPVLIATIIVAWPRLPQRSTTTKPPTAPRLDLPRQPEA